MISLDDKGLEYISPNYSKETSPYEPISPDFGPQSINLTSPVVSDIPDLVLSKDDEETFTSVNKDVEKEQNSQLSMLNVKEKKNKEEKKDDDIKKI